FPEYDTGLDLAKLGQLADYFREVRKRYWKFESNLKGVDAGVIRHQVPGGMMSNLVAQLREQGQEHRLAEVLEENARVRADLGYPPLVTPSSQIVGTQAVLNVLTGKRYGTVTRETRNLVKGLYGRPAAPISPEIQKQILGDEQPIDHRPADDLEPELEKAKAEIGDLAQSPEDVLSYVMFPGPAREFFEWRRQGGGPERELVAAVAAAMAWRPSAPGRVRAYADNGAVGVAAPGSLWRQFGRLRQMR
ncbi:MAG: pyruvate carboxylase subunit B, partial [Chloroflexota bacterium]|nr:pyruvate carboxylase subunit B [Chloroflexota bacterium]